MSDAQFSKFVPGFEFLQGLVKNAGSALPGIGQWVAPTLNPEELGKRIEELRTVQFWLEQNARMLAATIQALEVQRMTLSTLKTMNVPLHDLRDALKVPDMQIPGMPGVPGLQGMQPVAEQAVKVTKKVAKTALKGASAATRAAGKAAGREAGGRRHRRRSDAMVGRADAAVQPGRRQRDEGQRHGRRQGPGAEPRQAEHRRRRRHLAQGRQRAAGGGRRCCRQHGQEPVGAARRSRRGGIQDRAGGCAGAAQEPGAQVRRQAPLAAVTTMRCLAAHATHPDGRLAARLALTCLQPQWQGDPPSLGLVYLTDVLAPQAPALLDELQALWPATVWVGAASVGVLADGAEYLDEPAVALFVCDLPTDAFTLFSGQRPIGAAAAGEALLVHADPSLPELPELLAELQGAHHAGAALRRPGGLAHAGPAGGWRGAAGWTLRPALARRGRPAPGPDPRLPAAGGGAGCDRQRGRAGVGLDGEPALPRLLGDLGLDPQRPQAALPTLRGTLMGLRSAGLPARRGAGDALDDTVRVRPLIGLDLGRQGLALAEPVPTGMALIPCQRHAEAALRDLRRMATQLRAEVEDDGLRIAGAIYISCAGRGGPHFGAPHAEAQLLRHALGEVPTVGFFAGGEVLGGTLYGYSGVLAAFTAPARFQ